MFSKMIRINKEERFPPNLYSMACAYFWKKKKAWLKDEFLLPNIDRLVDASIGHSSFFFIDGFNGYR